MDSADFSGHEQLDQATRLLMASLRESRALNVEIREALQRREQADATEQPCPEDQSGTTVFRILSDVIGGGRARAKSSEDSEGRRPGQDRRPGKTRPPPDQTLANK